MISCSSIIERPFSIYSAYKFLAGSSSRSPVDTCTRYGCWTDWFPELSRGKRDQVDTWLCIYADHKITLMIKNVFGKMGFFFRKWQKFVDENLNWNLMLTYFRDIGNCRSGESTSLRNNVFWWYKFGKAWGLKIWWVNIVKTSGKFEKV